MSRKNLVFQPTEHVVQGSRIESLDHYQKLHDESLKDPAAFWSRIAEDFYWETKPKADNFLDYNFDVRNGPIYVKWMEGAVTNVCYNLLDRHVKNGNGEKIAFYWEGNDPRNYDSITYRRLLDLTCQFANGLRARKIDKGDRVCIYMPMILETVVAMLACSRIGAVHSVVFAGFSSDSLAERIADCEAKAVVTADGVWRGEKLLLLKKICAQAINTAESEYNHKVALCVVVSHLKTVGNQTEVKVSELMWNSRCDASWENMVNRQSIYCDPEWMKAEDPLLMLYTSGSTGKPKGVVHTTAGYLLYAAATFRYVFDYRDKDIYWCTADVGWITGHTYVLYGPLANCATSVLFEGTPFYPDLSRYWTVVEKYGVTQFYTAPTALRSLMGHGDIFVDTHDVSTLRVLGSVGEPINPEAWVWYYRVVGQSRCSIVDTYWQTETGGHVLTTLPAAMAMKPGSAGFPFFGVEPVLLDDDGKVIEGVGEGYLVFAKPWPGIMRTLYGDHGRYQSVYFTKFPGYYCTGDGAKRDKDGYLWVTGRIDDMLNVSGHLMSTAEVEGILTEDPAVAEAAVVSKPHPIKGESLYCFVTTADDAPFTPELIDTLRKRVRARIGAFAAPDIIQHAPALPKTRSGKIMRRILRKIALGDCNFGDTSTLADPTVVQHLFVNRL